VVVLDWRLTSAAGIVARCGSMVHAFDAYVAAGLRHFIGVT
jgi:hypothetical protein